MVTREEICVLREAQPVGVAWLLPEPPGCALRQTGYEVPFFRSWETLCQGPEFWTYTPGLVY